MSGIENYLGGLEEQNVREEKEIVTFRNPKVVQLLKTVEEIFRLPTSELLETYDTYLSYAQLTKLSSVDIKEFSVELKNYESSVNQNPNRTGMFLSALVNCCEDEFFEIVTAHLNQRLNYLCFKNKKNVTIIGDSGKYFGMWMMEGVLKLNGNAGDGCGRDMIGGEIYVSGDVENDLGTFSEGGRIYVSGKMRNICASCEAKIYKKGVQIWPK